MRDDLRELWKHRELLWILIQRDLKVRYKNSALGFGWSLLNPLLQVITITMVIKFMMRAQIPNYHVYVFCALLPWLFFSTAMLDTSFSLVAYEELLRKVYFPRIMIPLSAVAANFIHFMLATGVFLLYVTANALFFWGFHGRLEWPIEATVLLTPIPILGLSLLVTGMAFLVSIWTFYFHDVRFIADSGLRILYWLVPVMYFPDMIRHANPRGMGDLLYSLYLLNPLASFIDSFRKLTLVPTIMPGQTEPTRPMGSTEWSYLLIALATSAALAALGQRYFSRQQDRLAERA